MMPQSSENYNDSNQNTIYVAAKALDRLNSKLKTRKILLEQMKLNIELLSNDIIEIEESCQTIGNYINAVYCNHELYESFFHSPNKPTKNIYRITDDSNG